VANRLAAEARGKAARRRTLERQADEIPERTSPAERDCRELARLIDEELLRLPERLRLPLLLCYLQGHTVDQVARQLDWSLRTTERRLQQGRALLRARLVRRGVSLSACLIAAALAQNGARVAADLASTVRLARRLAASREMPADAPPRVLALARGMLGGTGVTKVKVGALLLAAVSLVAGGAATFLRTVLDRQPMIVASNTPTATARPTGTADPIETARADRFGDALPPGAVARAGTVRYRIPDPFAFALDAAGKSYAFGTDRGVSVCDVATGRVIRRLDSRGRAWGVAFSPDGATVAANETDCVEVWDVPGGRKLRAFELPRASFPRALLFSPDGTRLATDRDSGTIYFWDVKSGQEVWKRGRVDDSSWLLSLTAFAPDGKSVVALENRGEAFVLLDGVSGTPHRRLKGPGKGGSIDPVLSPNLTTYAAGPDRDWTLRIGDTTTGRDLHKLPGFASTREHFAFSRDGKTLAWCSEKQGVRLVDVASGKVLRRVGTALDDPAWWLRFLPGDLTLALCLWHENTVRFWDLPRDRELHPLGGHRGSVAVVSYTPDGRQLVSAAMDGTLRFWEPTTGRELDQVVAHHSGVWCLAVAPDGKTMASASANEKAISIRDLTTRKELRLLEVGESAQSLVFSPTGTTLLSGAHLNLNAPDNSAAAYEPRLWEVATGKEVRRYHVPGGSHCPAVFSPDGKYLASQGGDSLVVWEAATGRPVRQIPLGTRPPLQPRVTSVAFSRDGRTLVSAERDGRPNNPLNAVRFWELAGAKERLSIPCVPAWNCCVRFSPDGKYLAVADANHDVLVADAATGEFVRRFAGHNADVNSLAYTPDGKGLASAGIDTTILFWNTADLAAADPKPAAGLTGEELERLWGDLASADAAQAYRAIGVLAASPPRAVALLQEHLHPAALPDPARVARLISDLDDERFAVREQAAGELAGLAELAEPALRKALAGQPSPEGRRRITTLLEDLTAQTNPEYLRPVRAVELLERLDTPPARELLRRWAAGTAAARLTRESQETLGRLLGRVPAAPDGR
jgi:WD40 repeat protein